MRKKVTINSVLFLLYNLEHIFILVFIVSYFLNQATNN